MFSVCVYLISTNTFSVLLHKQIVCLCFLGTKQIYRNVATSGYSSFTDSQLFFGSQFWPENSQGVSQDMSVSSRNSQQSSQEVRFINFILQVAVIYPDVWTNPSGFKASLLTCRADLVWDSWWDICMCVVLWENKRKSDGICKATTFFLLFSNFIHKYTVCTWDNRNFFRQRFCYIVC